MDVLVLIDKLDEMVQNAKSVPMTDQVRIDREEIWEIIDQMRSEIRQALSDATARQKLAVQGLDVHYLPGPEFGKFIDSETGKWSKIIREAGINKR